MGNLEEDLRYMHAKLRGYEEQLATLRTLLKLYSKEFTLAEVERKLLLEIDNLEYCLKRDRINRGKPE